VILGVAKWHRISATEWACGVFEAVVEKDTAYNWRWFIYGEFGSEPTLDDAMMSALRAMGRNDAVLYTDSSWVG
jgi:hypothetical protein